MQILHRVSIGATAQIRRELAAMGISIGTGEHIAGNLVSFEVDELVENWPSVRDWIAKRDALDIVATKFSPKEIEEAAWLELLPSWHSGYPQPENTYLQATYDLSGCCERCGIGLRQNASFRMTGEPNWGKKSILQLNWVFDEYFITPELWATVFAPVGVRSRVVVNSRGEELKTVVQLICDQEVSVITDDLPGEECATCKRKKYRPVTRGTFPPMRSLPLGAVARTIEYFGSGASGYRPVLISGALARSLSTRKVRGVSLRPLEASRPR